ncbi:MAG TPA: aldehyde dehydrogenase family protein [Solirubrobacteraceae bacterium]|nr:aldehyde dehydrogenase family protein [Solirubrobacteraceae bacterium]
MHLMIPQDVGAKLAEEQSHLNLVDGELRDFPASDCLDIFSPARGTRIGAIPDSSPGIVEEAAQAAARAFRPWAETPPLERSRVLLRAANQLEERIVEIATLIALETGRPIKTETLPETMNAVKIFRYFGGLPLESKGETFLYGPGVMALTIREPLGVIAAITPWNVPAMLFCLKVAPALATGNTVVVKPAEQAGLSSLLVARVVAESLPPGVLNIVNGRGEFAGQALVESSVVRKITFTGSVDVGRKIAEQAATKLIPTTLELGGKSPIIVTKDVDVHEAAKQTVTGMRFSRQGQSCTSTTRILVHNQIREAFLAALGDTVKRMVVGDPLDDDTEIGTLVSREQTDRVRDYVNSAIREDIEVRELNEIAGGIAPDCFVPATLIIDPPVSSRVVQEEIFGPVATVHSWTTIDEVVELANGTEFGLSACILTDRVADALTLARRIEAGFVQVNSGMVIQPGLSFGGYKSSGIGREASLNSMLEAFTQVKTIIVDHS